MFKDFFSRFTERGIVFEIRLFNNSLACDRAPIIEYQEKGKKLKASFIKYDHV